MRLQASIIQNILDNTTVTQQDSLSLRRNRRKLAAEKTVWKEYSKTDYSYIPKTGRPAAELGLLKNKIVVRINNSLQEHLFEDTIDGREELNNFLQKVNIPAFDEKNAVKVASEKTAQETTSTIEKILVTLKKGLPELVTTVNMSAKQANSIAELGGDKHAEKAYKKLVTAADLIQESLTEVGKIK